MSSKNQAILRTFSAQSFSYSWARLNFEDFPKSSKLSQKIKKRHGIVKSLARETLSAYNNSRLVNKVREWSILFRIGFDGWTFIMIQYFNYYFLTCLCYVHMYNNIKLKPIVTLNSSAVPAAMRGETGKEAFLPGFWEIQCTLVIVNSVLSQILFTNERCLLFSM